MQETKTYTIRNVDQKPKTLIIEHAERPEYKLLNQKASETTTNAYRFEVKLEINSTEKFPVTEERVYDSATAVSNLTPDVLVTYVLKTKQFPIQKPLRKRLPANRRSKTTDSRPRQPDPPDGWRHQQSDSGSESYSPEHDGPESGERPAGSGAEVRAPTSGAREPVGQYARPSKRLRKNSRTTQESEGLQRIDRETGFLTARVTADRLSSALTFGHYLLFNPDAVQRIFLYTCS